MGKLVYERIGGNVLSIDLHNDYQVIALESYNTKESVYNVTFYLKEKTVNLLDLIESQENVLFETDKTEIHPAILKHVAVLLSQGFYDYYIRRYSYMMKCFDRGNEFFEKERLGNRNAC